MKYRLAIAAAAMLALPAAAEDPARVETTLIDSDGEAIGTLSLEPLAQGVRLELHAEQLDPGLHAVHIHTQGTCDAPAFKSAGGHFNPADARHGMPDGDEALDDQSHHAGDMVNQKVDDQGVLDTVIVNASVSLADGPNALRDDDGAALIVHSGPDDYHSQPSGAAGDRVACAVIEERA